MRGFDHWLTGGNYRKSSVTLRCVEDWRRNGTCDDGEDCKHEDPCGEAMGCGWTGEGTYHSEYGTGECEPSDCPDCGGEVRVI